MVRMAFKLTLQGPGKHKGGTYHLFQLFIFAVRPRYVYRYLYIIHIGMSVYVYMYCTLYIPREMIHILF